MGSCVVTWAVANTRIRSRTASLPGSQRQPYGPDCACESSSERFRCAARRCTARSPVREPLPLQIAPAPQVAAPPIRDSSIAPSASQNPCPSCLALSVETQFKQAKVPVSQGATSRPVNSCLVGLRLSLASVTPADVDVRICFRFNNRWFQRLQTKALSSLQPPKSRLTNLLPNSLHSGQHRNQPTCFSGLDSLGSGRPIGKRISPARLPAAADRLTPAHSRATSVDTKEFSVIARGHSSASVGPIASRAESNGRIGGAQNGDAFLTGPNFCVRAVARRPAIALGLLGRRRAKACRMMRPRNRKCSVPVAAGNGRFEQG